MKIGLQTWGSDGDIRPFLGLAGGLRARGHEVSLVITSVDNKDYTSYGKDMNFSISHAGNMVCDSKTSHLFADRIKASKSPLEQIEGVFASFYYPALEEMFAAADRLCKENDAIIGHSLHYAVQTAAEKAGKPYATVMMNHAGIYSNHSPIFGVPKLGKWMNPYWWKLFNYLIDRKIGSEVNKLRKQVGLTPAVQIADSVWMSKKLNLIAETSALGGKQPDWPDYHHVCGFFTVPDHSEKWAMPDKLKQFLKAGTPPVFMTLGSMSWLDTSPRITAQIFIQAALLAGCRAIIQSPWEELREIPDNSLIYKIQQAPHQYIFPYCSAVVHHGGAGTTHSAMLHGCPSIVIEHFGDQAFFAETLRRLGMAPNVLHKKSVTANKLAAAIREVLDTPSMKKRAEEVGAFMQKENGVKRAIELIEKHLLS